MPITSVNPPDNYGLGGTQSGRMNNTVTSSGSGSSSGSSVSTTNQNTVSNQSTSTNQKTTNLSSAEQKQLDALIKMLMQGGTPAMRQSQAERQGVIQDTLNQQGQYSKSAAFGDAQGLISQQMRRTLEQLLPSINRAAEDAGSSGGALRALLLQDAANKAAESSSALGVQTAVNYGNISANLSSVLERLTQTDPTVVNALLGALNVAKGATSTTVGTSNTSGSSSTSGTTTQQNQTDTSQGSQQTTQYSPFSVSTPVGSSTSPTYFGPSVSDQAFNDQAAKALANISTSMGNANSWSAYSF